MPERAFDVFITVAFLYILGLTVIEIRNAHRTGLKEFEPKGGHALCIGLLFLAVAVFSYTGASLVYRPLLAIKAASLFRTNLRVRVPQ